MTIALHPRNADIATFEAAIKALLDAWGYRLLRREGDGALSAEIGHPAFVMDRHLPTDGPHAQGREALEWGLANARVFYGNSTGRYLCFDDESVPDALQRWKSAPGGDGARENAAYALTTLNAGVDADLESLAKAVNDALMAVRQVTAGDYQWRFATAGYVAEARVSEQDSPASDIGALDPARPWQTLRRWVDGGCYRGLLTVTLHARGGDQSGIVREASFAGLDRTGLRRLRRQLLQRAIADALPDRCLTKAMCAEALAKAQGLPEKPIAPATLYELRMHTGGLRDDPGRLDYYSLVLDSDPARQRLRVTERDGDAVQRWALSHRDPERGYTDCAQMPIPTTRMNKRWIIAHKAMATLEMVRRHGVCFDTYAVMRRQSKRRAQGETLKAFIAASPRGTAQLFT